jgi:hypothetical protein
MRHMIRKAQLLILDETDEFRHRKAIDVGSHCSCPNPILTSVVSIDARQGQAANWTDQRSVRETGRRKGLWEQPRAFRRYTSQGHVTT